jgi:hypothetical protein
VVTKGMYSWVGAASAPCSDNGHPS